MTRWTPRRGQPVVSMLGHICKAEGAHGERTHRHSPGVKEGSAPKGPCALLSCCPAWAGPWGWQSTSTPGVVALVPSHLMLKWARSWPLPVNTLATEENLHTCKKSMTPPEATHVGPDHALSAGPPLSCQATESQLWRLWTQNQHIAATAKPTLPWHHCPSATQTRVPAISTSCCLSPLPRGGDA